MRWCNRELARVRNTCAYGDEIAMSDQSVKRTVSPEISSIVDGRTRKRSQKNVAEGVQHMNTGGTLLSSADAENLTDLLDLLKRSCNPDRDQIAELERTLDNAELLPPVLLPPDVVRIDCAIDVVDLRTGKKESYTIVLPQFADMAKRLVSVTAPLGIALLGRRQGEVIQVNVPGGVRLLRANHVRESERSASPEQQFCHRSSYH
jgi:regulator of nucleoside diphosphate kinase